jgi:hypothetical protein
MNRPIEKLITEPVLNDILKDYLSQFQQAGTTLSDESSKAVESKFWELIKPALGVNNWQGNNYKGSLQVDEIKKIANSEVKQILRPENFDANGNFKGGWNKDQDTENIKEVIGRDNFVNGKFKGGLDKQELIKVIGGDWNPLTGEYLGNKVFLLQTIKENSQSKDEIWNILNNAFDNKFSNGKYTGGWNKESDALAIAEALKPYKTWQETQNEITLLLEKAKTDLKTEISKNITDQADKTKKEANEYTDEKLKPYQTKEETSKEIETKLEPYKNWTDTEKEIEQKTATALTPFKNWEDTKKEIKPEVIATAKESLKPDGEAVLLEQLHLIFGANKFYPKKPKEGDKVPKGREGYFKDPDEIALMEYESKKKAEAADKWQNFFIDHGISSSTDKKYWMDEYGSIPENAERVYKKAALEAAKMVPEDRPLTDIEKETINTATMPERINEAVANIPKERKKKDWKKFFDKTDLKGEIKEEWKESWENSGLNIEQAEIVYKNGWRNDPAKGIIQDRVIKEHKTIEYVDDQPHEEIAKNINPLIISAYEVDKAQIFIIRQIRTQTDLTKFPTDGDIQNAFNQDLTTDSLKYEKISKLRDKTRTELFKKYFEGDKPSGLKDEQIEAWRTNETGLKMDGATQRQAFNNGWTDPSKITNGLWPDYNGVKNVNVLKYKPENIENEIKEVNYWVGEIKAYDRLRKLEENREKINEVLKNLNLELLPVGSKERITDAINEIEPTLSYHLDDPDDGGIEAGRLQQIEQAIKSKVWKPRNYEPFNTQILNALIEATEGLKVKADETQRAGNIDKWLISKGAYEISASIRQQEDKLPVELRGQFLLPDCFSKVKDARGNAFDVDMMDENWFCLPDFREESRWGRKKQFPIIKQGQGHLPFPTGSGKSTKTIDCIVRGGGADGKGGKDEISGLASRNVILVMPDQVLVETIYKHSTGWLQDWGCSIHHIWDRGVKVKKGTYTRATPEDIASGEFDIQDIFKSHGKYKVVKNELIPKGETGLSIITGDELIGYLDRQILVDSGAMDEWKADPNDPNWTQAKIDEKKRIIRENLIDKEKDIIVVDEAHTSEGKYQRVQIQAVHGKYKVIRMSATFEGQPFSITSTYPRDNLYAGDRLDPNMPIRKEGNKILTLDEALRTGKTAIFLPDLKLTPKQQQVLSNVSYMVYTEEWNEYLEAVSFGMPKGGLNILWLPHSVGINGDFDTVIPGGKLYVRNLGKRFEYSKPSLKNLTQADGVQQIGRTARFKKGAALLLSLKWEDIDASEDVESAMVDAVFDGELKHIVKMGYKMLSDINMLRAAIALPDNFGKSPAEILIGLKVNEDAEEKRAENNEKAKEKPNKYTYQPLTKIEWRKENEKPEGSKLFGTPDEGLWNRYLGKKETITMDKDKAKDRLLENISTFISENAGFPRKIKVWNQSNLIDYIWGKTYQTQKPAIIEEVRKVLNGVILKSIDNYKSEEYDKSAKTSKRKEIIETVANYYKIADANIDISPQLNKEGKRVLTLQIEKN